ncbi:hypothetical protein [Kitasatospora sp. NBC_01539]|uniref:hypothetical protein n=1 Tax=Kitasatospora sp. NBC_01539 TaxID=2903577 RepID=UPI0038600BA6
MATHADRGIEVGPDAGGAGSRVVFKGILDTPAEARDSPTAQALAAALKGGTPGAGESGRPTVTVANPVAAQSS